MMKIYGKKGGDLMSRKTMPLLALFIALSLCLTMIAGCGSAPATSEDGVKEDAKTTVNEEDFLLGSWIAESCWGEDPEVTADPYDVYGGTFSLYFSDNGECTMWVGQNRAVVTWERTEDGVLLKGDNEYPITFPDGSETEMIIVVNNVNTLMEKYVEEEEEASD